ncbi:PAC2 family protein [Chloroflexota bacterium]
MIEDVFELSSPLPQLKEPHALAILQPWINVGNVGTLVFSWLEKHFSARELGKLARPGDFFDFTRYRPTIFTREDKRQVNIPNIKITYTEQKTGNDFLFFHLLEPHSRSEDFNDAVLQLLVKLEVKRYCLIGSMFDYSPHTRPLTVTGSSASVKPQQEADKMDIKKSNYQGPTTITSLISQQASAVGIETMSYIVHLPQYTQLEEDYMGTVRIIEMLGSLYSIPVDESYIKKAERQREQIDSALDKNPQLRAAVEQLEKHFDSRAERHREEEMPRLSPEVEKFLAEMDRRFRED